MAFIFDKLGLPSLPSSGLPFPNPGRIFTTAQSFFTQEWEELWGIFDNDFLSWLDFDTIEEVGMRASSTIARFPVQFGGFATYNKAHNPDEFGVIVSKGGLTQDGRQEFIKQLYDLKHSLDLVNLVTPDRVYYNVNMFDFDFRATAQAGSHIVTAQLKFMEVREVKAQYVDSKTTTVNAKDPSAKPAVDKGTVQPKNKTTITQDIKSTIDKGVDLAKQIINDITSWYKK